MVKTGYTPTASEIQQINNTAIKAGWCVHPEICTPEVADWVRSLALNVNSTFYRRWSDITDKSRLELLIDQLIHYASTYGTNYEAETYCPNGDPIKIDYKQYRVLTPVTPEEMFEKIMATLRSGIALKEEVVQAFCWYLLKTPDKINLDDIANRDALVVLCAQLRRYPDNPEMIMRYIFYITTGSAMIIKNKFMLRKVECAADKIDLRLLTDDQLIGLAGIFNRYKDVFMRLKNYRLNKAVVNKISRLSKTHHKPFRIGYWENITNMEHIDWNFFDKKVSELTNPFKVVKLLEMIKMRKILAYGQLERSFVIRNGKIWADHDALVPYHPDYDTMATKLLARLVWLVCTRRINGNLGTKIKLPKCTLVCPMSEKKFLGNLPMGSYFELASDNNYFGIYWRNEWGTHDFDLSMFDEFGRKYGWNADFYDRDEDIIFSGDMTDASPEATEMFHITGNVPDCTLFVNRYNGDPDSQYRIFFGQDDCKGFGMNYMVDPNTITFEDMAVSTSKEQIVGHIANGKMYFFNLASGNRTVSCIKNHGYMKAQCLAHIELQPILEAAGYEIVDKDPDIDLSTPSKEMILKLFVG